MPALKSVYFKYREAIRRNIHVARTLYFGQSLLHSNFHTLQGYLQAIAKKRGTPEGVALFCRVCNEARYLPEWIEYYLAAGVSHFFFYESFSSDNYREVLQPFIDRGLVTLLDNWPYIPVSPAAEHDCVLRAVGRFEWVGFLDSDEFAVIKDNRSLPEFLDGYRQHPAVCLHWVMFGSNGHKTRPAGPVIYEYTRRDAKVNAHVKPFLQPALVTRCRNPHSWYYRGMQFPVNENFTKVGGSLSVPPSASKAWINHYHHKSEEDYFAKMSRKTLADKVGMTFSHRTEARRAKGEESWNAVEDHTSTAYYEARCRITNRFPQLSQQMHRQADHAQVSS